MFYDFIILLAKAFCYCAFHMTFCGLENVPKNTGYVLACNHRTNFDPIFASIRTPAHLHFMAKEELFHNPFLRWLISHLGAFPVSRGSGDKTAMNKAITYLSEGCPLLIFIEGTRSKTGIPGRPRSGAVLLAKQANVGIIPCSISFEKKLRFRTKVTITYHPMLTQEQLAVDEDSPGTIKQASRMVMEQILAGLPEIPKQGATT